MKRIYMLLAIFIALPLSVFASSTDITVNNGIEMMSSQETCVTGGGTGG